MSVREAAWSDAAIPERFRPHERDRTRVVLEGLDEICDQRTPHRVLVAGRDPFDSVEGAQHVEAVRRLLDAPANPRPRTRSSPGMRPSAPAPRRVRAGTPLRTQGRRYV